MLGYSTKTESQIGQFGEGKKLACLVLARSQQIGAVRCETVGYSFTPTVERRRLLDGVVPSRSAHGTQVLVYHLAPNTRRRGTVFTVTCSRELALEAIGRFRTLSEPGYTRPAAPGACVLAGEPGRVWIGGVLVTTVDGFLASYDLPLSDKALQNRDRTVIEAGALRDAVRAILAASQDQAVIGLFATHVLDGGRLREPEQFFSAVKQPRLRAAWRTWARAHLPAQRFYTGPGNEEAALDLKDHGFTELAARGLADHQQYPLMELLDVTLARHRQQRHYESTRTKTTWVAEHRLTTTQRTSLTEAVQLVRHTIGAFALHHVRVYSKSEATPCAEGFYSPTTGDIAVHIDVLTDREQLLGILLHEAAHRVAHRGGGRWRPVHDYTDRCRGFEDVLTDFAGLLLQDLTGSTMPPKPADPTAHPPDSTLRPSAVDDPTIPLCRRDLARLLADRLPHALTAGGFTNAKDLVACTAVPYDIWRTLSNPKPAGFRRYGSGGQAFNYERVAVLAEAVGLYPPVLWLGYNLCEGAMHGRRREQWGQPGAWAKTIREVTERACNELEVLGGAYAEPVPVLRSLASGHTPVPAGDDTWHAPALALIALERQRLGLAGDPAPAKTATDAA